MQTGLISGDRHLALADMQHHVLQAATGFAKLGVGPRDAVALLLRNDVPFLVSVFAANRLGAYGVPINWHFKAPEVGYILRDCGAKVLVVHADLLASVEEAVPPDIAIIVVPTPEDVARAYGVSPAACAVRPGRSVDHHVWHEWLAKHAPSADAPRPSGGGIIYTSGTTGRPKGVRRTPPTADQIKRQEQLARQYMDFRPGLRTLVPGPLYHSAPFAFATRCAPVADVAVLMPRFEPVAFLETIERERIEHMFAVPTMFVRLLKLPDEVKRRYDLSSLRFVSHAAAPCPPDVKQAMIDWWGPVLSEFYGGTESGALTVCSSEEWLAKRGTVGRAVEGVKLAIYSDDGQVLPAGEIGEVYGRQLGLADFTYQGKPEERAKIERDGLITCGDVGYLDADGYLFLCDRKRDMIILGGVNIYPAEIEAVLIAASGVADCAVFGIPDDDYGEAVMAVVEPQSGVAIDLAAVRTHLVAHLANYKVPRRIEVQAGLPREDSGKIFKRLLREPFWAGRMTRI
jgi:long-chain acyl-CoA synthetase